jgi:bilirubin oxidase
MRAPSPVPTLVLLAALAGCAGPAAPEPAGPTPTPGAVVPPHVIPAFAEPAPLADREPAAGHVAVLLRAAPADLAIVPGKTTPGYAYNGVFPGPTLEVSEGDEVFVQFKNDLPEPSNVHWHGLKIPPAQDGLPEDLVPPGGTRNYVFKIPPGSAGTYWYHPHPHGATVGQVAKGLVGAIRVKAPDDPLAGLRDQLVVLTDHKVDAEGRFMPTTNMDRADGVEGNVVLVNGKIHPMLPVRPGELRRLRFVNASASRFYQVHVPGHSLWQVGTDGGLFGTPVERSAIVLAPAERAEVVVRMTGAKLSEAIVESLPVNRGAMPVAVIDPDQPAGAPTPPGQHVHGGGAGFPLFAIAYGDEPVTPRPALPATLRPVAPLDVTGAEARLFTLTENMLTLDFRINGQVYGHDRIDVRTKRGATEVWTIANDADMDHPFHLHGVQFQVLDRDGVPELQPAWKDTVNVPARAKVRFAVKFDVEPGKRVYHCHILHHEDAGMMGALMVE